MQIFYTRYKEMKRVIRDDAAVDIQRCARGFKVRSHLSRFSGMLLAPGSSGHEVMGTGTGTKGVSGRDGGRKIPEGSSFPQGHSSSFDRTMSGKSAHSFSELHCIDFPCIQMRAPFTVYITLLMLSLS